MSRVLLIFGLKNSVPESKILPSSPLPQNRIFGLFDLMFEFRVNLRRKATTHSVSLPLAPIGNLRADLETSKTSILGSSWRVLVSPSWANEKASFLKSANKMTER